MQVKAFGQTDTGLKRSHNEDAFKICEDIQLYIVCDGVGGLAAGEVASQMACVRIAERLRERVDVIESFGRLSSAGNRLAVLDCVREAIAGTSREIWELSQQDEGERKRATTLVMVLVVGDDAFVAHVGDSRLYLFRGSEGFQLTEDHTYVNELVKNGKLTEEEAKNHPQAHVITKALGFRSALEIETLHMELENDDRLLLCSDGLYHYFSTEQFGKLMKGVDGGKFNELAIAQANALGGRDNITSLHLQVSAEGKKDHATGVSQKIAVLKRIALFKALSFKELAKVLEIIKIKSFAEKTLIIHEGDMGDEMYIILLGSVDVMISNKTIKTIPKGAYFGEMALVDKEIRSASILAREPTKTLVIQRDDLLSLFKRENRIGLKMMWAMLQHANARLRGNDKKVYR